MKSTTQTVFVAGLVGVLCLGFGVYAGFLLTKTNTPVYEPVVSDLSVTRPVEEVKPSQIIEPDVFMTLNFGTRITVPKGWKVTLLEYGLDPQKAQYIVNTGDQEFGLTEIKASVWSRGPWLENQGNSPMENRPIALTALKQVYENQALTETFNHIFDENAGEFFGYSSNNRVARRYVASANNNFRGLSFFNLNGQSSVLSPNYHVVVYNPVSDVILFAGYGQDDAPEIAAVNAQIVKGMQAGDSDVIRLDKQARADFTKLVETQPRSELSFGKMLDSIDQLVKSAEQGYGL